MSKRLKQRAVIEFLIKEFFSAVQIHTCLKNMYSDAVIEVKKFKKQETEIVDKPRKCFPSTSNINDNCSRVNELIRQERCIPIQKICDAVHMSYGSAQAMVKSLEYHKVCVKWVPSR